MKLLLGLLLVSLPALAAPPCAVPVCDIPATVESLRAKSQAERYQVLIGHIATANQSTDPAVLANLLAFSEAARELLTALNEEKWLVEAAKNLGKSCVVRLAKHSAIDDELLLGFFRRLYYEQDRFDVLQHWAAQVRNLEDKETLRELGRFLTQAGAYCASLEDGDYVIDAARRAETAIHSRIIRLQPTFEGVFVAELQCQGTRCAGTELIDRITIMDTLLPENIQVTLSSSRLGVVVYSFQSIVMSQGGTHFEGLSRNAGTGTLAKLAFDLDPATRVITGTIETPEVAIRFTGHGDLDRAPIRLFDERVANPRPDPLTPAFFERTMYGAYAGRASRLKVNVFDDETVGGTLTIGEGNGLRIRFQGGRFFPKSGIVILISNTTGGGILKMYLSVANTPRNAAGDYDVTGLTFNSLNGTVNNVDLTATPAPAPAPADGAGR
jgi:hypothetical protein